MYSIWLDAWGDGWGMKGCCVTRVLMLLIRLTKVLFPVHSISVPRKKKLVISLRSHYRLSTYIYIDILIDGTEICWRWQRSWRQGIVSTVSFYSMSGSVPSHTLWSSHIQCRSEYRKENILAVQIMRIGISRKRNDWKRE